MAYGLPALGETTWGQKILDSFAALKATADAAQPAATLDASTAALVDTNGDLDAALSGVFAKVVTPEKHGAVGDAVADDTTSITDAVAELVAGDTLFLRRNYLTTASHTIPAGVTIDGPGTLKRSGATTSAILTLGAGCKVRNVTLDGSAVCQYVAQVAGDRVTFDGCEVNDSDLYGIGCNGYAELAVTNCRFYNNDLYAVLVENTSPRARIVGNLVHNTVDGHGIFLKSGTSRITDGLIANNVVIVAGGLGIEYWGDRGSVTGNTVRATGTVIGISLATATETAVAGNTVTYDTASPAYGIEMAEGTSRCSVSGNVVIGASVGIIVSKGGSATSPEGNTITGNTIRNTTSYAINLEYASRCVIAANSIHDPANRAIFINNGSAALGHHLVQGNRISRTDATTGDAIHASGEHLVIVGNQIDYMARTSATGYGVYLVAGSNDCQVSANHIAKVSNGIGLGGTSRCLVDGNQTHLTGSNSVVETGTNSYNIVSNHYDYHTAGNGVVLLGATCENISGYIRALGFGTYGRVGKLGVGNSAAAATPGTVTKKVEIFNQAGTSLGFIPVYDAIT